MSGDAKVLNPSDATGLARPPAFPFIYAIECRQTAGYLRTAALRFRAATDVAINALLTVVLFAMRTAENQGMDGRHRSEQERQRRNAYNDLSY